MSTKKRPPKKMSPAQFAERKKKDSAAIQGSAPSPKQAEPVQDMRYDLFSNSLVPVEPGSFDVRSYVKEILAVGLTVEGALARLMPAKCNCRLDAGSIRFQSEEHHPARWFVRFSAGGISFKAAGEYICGGVIVTWLK